MASLSKGGYVVIYTGNYRYRFEHVLIMEKYLGRELEPNIEDVHHINGIKTDNRLENLQLITHSEHTKLHNYVDMTKRICSRCNSDKTLLQHRNNRPNWYYDKNNKIICNRCYLKDYRGGSD